jgi:hypothetical protein
MLPLALARPAYARQDCGNDRRVFGDDFTLASGETIDGNLVILGGDVEIAAGATVECDVVVMGGNLELAGEVNGDVVVFGGNTDLRETAVIEGQLVSNGGSVTREEGSQVKGGETRGFSFSPGSYIPRVSGPFSLFNPLLALVTNFAGSVVVSIALMFLALLVALFLPDQTRRVTAALTTAPMTSGLMGLLTFFAMPVLIVLTAITICLIPVSLLGAMIFAMALIFGWVAVGALLGERLVAALRLHNVSPALSTALGTLIITFSLGILDTISEFGGGWLSIPLACITVVVPLVLIFIGLGGVTLTRFGTRPFVSMGPTSPSAPPPSAPPGDVLPPPSFAGDPPQPAA